MRTPQNVRVYVQWLSCLFFVKLGAPFPSSQKARDFHMPTTEPWNTGCCMSQEFCTLSSVPVGYGDTPEHILSTIPSTKFQTSVKYSYFPCNIYCVREITVNGTKYFRALDCRVYDINRKFVASVYTRTEAHDILYFAGYADVQNIHNVRRAYKEHTAAWVYAIILTHFFPLSHNKYCH